MGVSTTEDRVKTVDDKVENVVVISAAVAAVFNATA